MATAVLTIDINARLASLEQGLANAVRAVGGSSNKISSQLAGLNSQIKGFGLAALGAFGVPIGVAGFVSAISTIADKTIEGERALNQLNSVLKATGNAAGLTRDDLLSLGKEIQSKTVFDDDAITAASTALLRFRTIQGDTFREALRLTPDVAAVLGVKLPEAAVALGRALSQDGTAGMKALKSAGVQLSDQQIDLAERMTEVGNKAGAQRLKLDEITKSIGGTSEADNTGMYGSTKRLARSWDDLQKAFGKRFFADNNEDIDALTGFLDKLIERVEKARIKWTDLLKVSMVGIIPGNVVGGLIGDALLPGPQRGAGVSGKIGGQPDLEKEKAEAAQLAASEQEAANQRYKQEQAALKQRADGAAAYYGTAFALLKSHLDAQKAALDFSYQQNEISSAVYYARELALAEKNFEAQEQYLLKQAAAQQALRRAPSTSLEERGAIDLKLDAIAQQLTANAAARDKAAVSANQAHIVSVQKLADDYEQLNIQILEVSGNTVEAANRAFALATRGLRERIGAEINSPDAGARARAEEAAATIERLRIATDTQARLTQATSAYTLSVDAVGRAEERINIARDSGAVTELQALAQISTLRASKVGVLMQELDILQRIAAAMEPGPAQDAALANLDAMRVKLEALAATGDLVAKKFNDIGAGAFSDALAGLATGEKTFKQAAVDFSKSITSSVVKVFSDDLAQQAFGKGGPLSGFGDMFSKLLGGTGKDAAGVAGATALTTAQTALTTTTSATTVAMTAVASAASAAAAALASVSASSGASSLGGLGSLFGSAGSGASAATPYVGEYFPYGGGYASGSAYVPRTSLYMLHKGERVTTADRNRGGRDPGMRERTAGYGRGIERPIIFNQTVAAGANTQTARHSAKWVANRAAAELRRG